MFRTIPKVTLYSLTKKIIIGLICIYAAAMTFVVVKYKPQPVLIGIDSYGTRIIKESGDRLFKKEKENFLKRFTSLLYNYDAETFEKRVSDCGDLMAEALWKTKREEFQRIGSQLKVDDLVQSAQVLELREIDEWTYQADIQLTVKRKLTEAKAKLRVEFRLRPNPRRENNPYPFEVEFYDEQQAI